MRDTDLVLPLRISISLYLELYLRRDRTVYAHARRKRGRPRSTTGGARTHGVHKSPGRAGPSPSPWDDTMPRIAIVVSPHTHGCNNALRIRHKGMPRNGAAPPLHAQESIQHSSTRTPQRSRLFSFSNSTTRTRKHLSHLNPLGAAPRPASRVSAGITTATTPATSKTSRDAGPTPPTAQLLRLLLRSPWLGTAGQAEPLTALQDVRTWPVGLPPGDAQAVRVHTRATYFFLGGPCGAASQARKWHRQRSVRRM